MDATSIKELQNLFFKDIRLHSDLVACLNTERAALVDIDLERLWPLAQEKQALALKINDTKKQIGVCLSKKATQLPANLDQVLSCIPKNERAHFQKLYLNVIRLESEVRVLRDENMVHIKDSLSFLDEMISIISGQNDSQIMYTNKSHMKKNCNQMLLNREV